MKYLPLLIVSSLVPFFSLYGEDVETEDLFSTPSLSSPLQEEASFSSLEEELSLLDEEFESFKEELFFLENALQKKDSLLNPDVPDTTQVSEHLNVAESSTQLIETAEPPALASPSLVNAESDHANDLLENQQVRELTPVSLVETTHEVEQKPIQEFPALLTLQGTSLIKEPAPKKSPLIIDLNQVFSGSPLIYSVLLAMSVIAVGIWLYSMVSLHSAMRLPGTLMKNIQNKLNSNHFEEALSICTEQDNLFCKMIACGIQSRRHGLPVMIEAMKAEGKRTSITFWQKLGLLNDIAIIAPMIGLLGTVLGMFYAFYDINRSIESVSTLFDGLGISVGTTVAGLIVAILALILHSTAKYRLVKALSQVENETQQIATLIDDRTSLYNKG